METYDPFNISAILPDFDAQFAECRRASEATRRALRSQLDVPYGAAPRQRIDLFFPEGDATGRPVHLFIHGGYWRAQVKEDYVFVADAITAAGAIAAIVEYTLMPGVPMGELVRQVREAAGWVAAHAHEFGGDGTRLTASGHSAGGHLVTYLTARGPHEGLSPQVPVRGVMSISGIFDLRPITGSYLQPELHLTPEDVAHWSPCGAIPVSGTHVEIVVGRDETLPFHQQAQDYAFALERHGAGVERVTLHGEDHMSAVLALRQPGSQMWSLMADLIVRSRR